MDTPHFTITQPRSTLVNRLAGALAETSTSSLTLHTPGEPDRPLSPRNTDLPAVLRHAPAGTRLTTPGGCTITLTDEGCAIDMAPRTLIEALEPISR